MSIYRGLDFVMTCGACPEQYDVMEDGAQVGYVRLRWGHLTCQFRTVSGPVVYSHSFDDGMQGCFEDSEQREEHLGKCADALMTHMGRRICNCECHTTANRHTWSRDCCEDAKR